MDITGFTKVIHSQGRWEIFMNEEKTEILLTYRAQPFLRSWLDRMDKVHQLQAFHACQGYLTNKDINDLEEVIPVVVGLVTRYKKYSERAGKVIDVPTL